MNQKELNKYILYLIKQNMDENNILINIKRLHVKKYHPTIADVSISNGHYKIIEYYLKSDLISNEQKNMYYIKLIFRNSNTIYNSDIIYCFKNKTDLYLYKLICNYFSLLCIMNIDFKKAIDLYNIRNKYIWSTYSISFNENEILEINEIFNIYRRMKKMKNIIK